MRRSIALMVALVLALLATAATTRTTTGCAAGMAHCASAVPIAAAISIDVPLPVAPPRPQAPWIDCAAEKKTCRGEGWGEVRFGAKGKWRRLTVQGGVRCEYEMFGDPLPGVVKRCERRAIAAPLMPADITPIASGFDPAALIVSGVRQEVPSGRPDVVGAFRMICTAGQLNYDDPILYPGSRGGSPHLHQWYGNSAGNYASTYASLRASGESTCSNKLNRSAYWVPALMTATGKVIQPDYVSLYYKRLPDDDPECVREAPRGCVGLPTGLRVVSGYDMGRMGEEQPENTGFHFGCILPGKPSDHRRLISEAIADCGGSGQIMATVDFGGCWNGMLDSADHRSHLAGGSYGSWGYLKCPASHPYLIPKLTQGVVYTIQPSDGEVWFASDRMGGMAMPPGSTFHADYMEGWDPGTRATWERRCIGKLLTCSDGELGDGTMLARGSLTYHAATRLIDVRSR